MTRDRLPALRAAQAAHANYDTNNDDDMYVTIQANSLQKFQKEVEEIQELIEGMEDLIEELRRLHSHILLDPQAGQNTKKRVESIMAEIVRSAKIVRARLGQIGQDIGNLQAAGKGSSNECRVKKVQHQQLSQRVGNLLNEYNLMQCDYRDKIKGNIQRQLEITGQQATDEEVEEILEGQQAQIFADSTLADNQQARQVLSEIESRRDEILQLEKSVRELHELFVDMASMVTEQGELVDRIENNIDTAVVAAKEAKENVVKAVDYQSKARRKKCCCFLLLIILIIVIVLAIAIPLIK